MSFAFTPPLPKKSEQSINDRAPVIERAPDCAPTIPSIPAIALINPKYIQNVAAIVHAASCFNVSQVWFTGTRIDKDLETKTRIPRELRMKEYADVKLTHCDYFIDQYHSSAIRAATPVIVELTNNSEPLTFFEHPENALYIFGPEDGSVNQMYRRFGHRFVHIPSKHCVNLSAAVHIILADRLMKQQLYGQSSIRLVSEVNELNQTDSAKNIHPIA